jgi:L-alanine-DL-glutamate epimerase-like enolase superfamily enzyme
MSIDTLEDALRAATELGGLVPFALETPAHATGIADRITMAPAARFAIETALLAAFSQRAHTSVASLWTAVPQAELRYATIVDDELEARAAVARGARCLKLKAASEADLDRVHCIASAAPGVRLRIDANGKWSRDGTHQMMKELRGLCIDYIEEPCRDAHELLAIELPFRIALDESLVELGSRDLARALESPALAALVLKPTLLGGFARCLELAGLAHRHGVAPIVSHTLEGPIGYAACIELARAIGADVPVGLAPHSALVAFSEHA